MKELTFKIPNEKVDFLKTLMKQLGFELSSEIMEVSEEDKNEVRRRMKNSSKDSSLIQDWDLVKNSFKID